MASIFSRWSLRTSSIVPLIFLQYESLLLYISFFKFVFVYFRGIYFIILCIVLSIYIFKCMCVYYIRMLNLFRYIYYGASIPVSYVRTIQV